MINEMQVINVSKMEFTGRNGEPVTLYRHTCICKNNGVNDCVLVNSRTEYQVNDILKPDVFLTSDKKLSVRVVKA